MTAPDRLPFTGDEEADRLIARDPLALLTGFVLDQQVTLQKAFAGPLELRRRIGTLDAAGIATFDPVALEAAFATPPALHRFPANMARRTQALCAAIAHTTTATLHASGVRQPMAPICAGGCSISRVSAR